MMPTNRFGSFNDDRDLLDKCDSLKLQMFKDEEGVTSVFFELSGSLNVTADDEGGPFAPQTKADLSFVRGLIEKFQKAKE